VVGLNPAYGRIQRASCERSKITREPCEWCQQICTFSYRRILLLAFWLYFHAGEPDTTCAHARLHVCSPSSVTHRMQCKSRAGGHTSWRSLIQRTRYAGEKPTLTVIIASGFVYSIVLHRWHPGLEAKRRTYPCLVN